MNLHKHNCRICGVKSEKTICDDCKLPAKWRMEKRVCKTCKLNFFPRTKNQIYCKLTCDKNYSPKSIKRKKKCKNCKHIFSTKSNKRIYCKDCNTSEKRKIIKKFGLKGVILMKKYPTKEIVKHIRDFYNDKELTIPMKDFRNHPLVREVFLSTDKKSHNRCHYLAKLIKIPKGQLCEECNISLAKVRHHPDYTQPLFIRYLCSSCHARLHHTKDSKLVEVPNYSNKNVISKPKVLSSVNS